jgi:hypothetical protein
MNEKIIYIIFGIILAISVTFNITGSIGAKRATDAYNKLEAGYTIIEGTNSKLREENSKLISNNKQLRDEQQRSADLISTGQGIIREFEEGLGESLGTIDRIERTIGTLEQLITVLYSEDGDMERDSDRSN